MRRHSSLLAAPEGSTIEKNPPHAKHSPRFAHDRYERNKCWIQRNATDFRRRETAFVRLHGVRSMPASFNWGKTQDESSSPSRERKRHALTLGNRTTSYLVLLFQEEKMLRRSIALLLFVLFISVVACRRSQPQ